MRAWLEALPEVLRACDDSVRLDRSWTAEDIRSFASALSIRCVCKQVAFREQRPVQTSFEAGRRLSRLSALGAGDCGLLPGSQSLLCRLSLLPERSGRKYSSRSNSHGCELQCGHDPCRNGSSRTALPRCAPDVRLSDLTTQPHHLWPPRPWRRPLRSATFGRCGTGRGPWAPGFPGIAQKPPRTARTASSRLAAVTQTVPRKGCDVHMWLCSNTSGRVAHFLGRPRAARMFRLQAVPQERAHAHSHGTAASSNVARKSAFVRQQQGYVRGVMRSCNGACNLSLVHAANAYLRASMRAGSTLWAALCLSGCL